MPLELDAVVRAFGLAPAGDGRVPEYEGRLGGSDVTAIHIGMGPALTRAALAPLLDSRYRGHRPVDHVMVAGICGGLSPELDVGSLVNPETVVEHSTGASYRHSPPGDAAVRGKLVTTEDVTLDHALSRQFYEDGFLAVDMETSAVAEVCESYGVEWSVYRCIGDRYFDGLLDERLLAITSPDGSGNMAELARLLESEPDLAGKLEQLSRDATLAARLAAEAAVRGCLALDT
jgi:nucleoside phosphorylase